MQDTERYPSVRQYINSSISLASLFEQHMEDIEFGRNGGEIIYMFDTNVCFSYLNSKDSAGAITKEIKHLFRTRESITIEKVTARFLFEGHLPAQKSPVFLSPPHWNETLNLVDQNESKSAVAIGSIAPNILTKLNDLRSLKNNYSAFMARAREIDVVDTLIKLADRASIARKAKILWQTGNSISARKISKFDSSIFWTLIDGKVRREDYRFWQLELTKELSLSEAITASNGNRNIDRDAMTLAIIQALYKETPEAGGINQSKKFIFVTLDEHLKRVVNNNLEKFELDNHHSFIRSPDTYLPIISHEYVNEHFFQNRYNPYEKNKLIEDIEDALDAALPFKAASITKRHRLIWEMDFKESVNKWSDIAEMFSLVGTDLFREEFTDQQSEYRGIIELLESENIAEAALNILTDTIQGIKEDHTKQMSTVAIGQLAERTKNGLIDKANSSASHRRAPLAFLDVDLLSPIRINESKLFSNVDTLDQFLSKIASNNGSDDPNLIVKTALENLMSAWKNEKLAPACYLLASSVYFLVGAWDSAKNCAELCQTAKIGKGRYKDPWVREARYAKALALRMTLKGANEFVEAKNLLDENMIQFDKELAYYRDMIERAALLMTASLTQFIFDSKSEDRQDSSYDVSLMEHSKISEEFDRAIFDAGQAAEKIGEQFIGTNVDHHNQSLRMLIQARTNILGSYLHAYFYEGLSQDKYTKSDIQRAADELNKTLALGLPGKFHNSKIYLMGCDILQTPSAEKLKGFQKLVKDLRRSSIDLSESDDEEHNYLFEQLKDYVNE